MVKKLKGYKVITTQKIPGVECTRDKNMSLLDIANLTIGCRNVVAIHTAPMVTAVNTKSINTVQKWVLLNDKNITYKIVDMVLYDDVKKIKMEDFGI